MISQRLPVHLRQTITKMLPRRLLRWYRHANTDVYLISYPKCGRTWLRLMIGRAITCHYSLPDDEKTLFLSQTARLHPDVPRISVIHDDRPMLKTPEELENSKSRYKNKRVILLVRDPRDVIVSSYFEMNKRGTIFGDNPYENRPAVFEGGLNEFIERREGGFDTLLRFYNIWAENRDVPRGFLLIRYEDMKTNSAGELRRALDFLGLREISDAIILEAVEYASFENMRKMESEGRFQTGMLNPADRQDQESYKTRKGQIGGYRQHLDEKQIERLTLKMNTSLSEIYGYTP